jgi:Matrixin
MIRSWRPALALAVSIAAVCGMLAAPAFADRSSVREAVYELKPRFGPPLGQCVAPSDSDSAAAFTLGGWKVSTLNLATNGVNVPAGVDLVGALNGAVGEWEGNTDVPNSAFNTGSTTTATRSRLDGVNLVAFGKIGSAVGVTRFFISGSTVIESDTLLNSKYPWSDDLTGGADASGGCNGTAGAFDVQAVLTHELGHPLGLEHILNDVQTMYPAIGTGESRKRTLALGDRAGANQKYP